MIKFASNNFLCFECIWFFILSIKRTIERNEMKQNLKIRKSWNQLFLHQQEPKRNPYLIFILSIKSYQQKKRWRKRKIFIANLRCCIYCICNYKFIREFCRPYILFYSQIVTMRIANYDDYLILFDEYNHAQTNEVS